MTHEEASSCTILHAIVGSRGVGLERPDSDIDEMGVLIEPIHEAYGLSAPFEQFVRTGPEDRRQGNDIQIYGLRKFLRLALSGNPTIMMLLFIPSEKLLKCDARGAQLRELTPHIVSRLAGKAFLGYMQAQRQRLVGERGQKGVNRPELVEKYGYDTKYAMHILRLGIQGKELLETGALTVPLREEDRLELLAVRDGKWKYQEVLTAAGELEADLKTLLDTSPLPPKPNDAIVEEWMLRTYFRTWSAQRKVQDAVEDATIFGVGRNQAEG